jgi:hypothetical protein
MDGFSNGVEAVAADQDAGGIRKFFCGASSPGNSSRHSSCPHFQVEQRIANSKTRFITKQQYQSTGRRQKMSQIRLYALAFTLMLLIYAVAGAFAWQSASVAAEALKHRAEELEQAQALLSQR